MKLTAEQQNWISDMILHSAAPDTRPFYARLIMPADGRIWVSLNQPLFLKHPDVGGWSYPQSGLFDVMEGSGEWRGIVRFPPEIVYDATSRTPPLAIRGDTVWALVLDSMDVQYVGKYVVEWPPRRGNR